MTIVLTGGGSGGHITPLLVVASELKRQKPDLKIIYIGQKGDGLADIPAKDPNIDQAFSVRAGKFRRYHGEGLKQVLHIPTMLKNLRDMVFVAIGLAQSFFVIRKIKPDIVFSRGGFVSVPVCLAAKFNRVSYITHDSDPVPSLTNRIIGPGAKLHLVAQPKEIYPYPEAKTLTTGIPVSRSFVRVTPKVKREYRQKLNIKSQSKLLFVVGGGLGALSLNEALHEILPNLLAEFTDLKVVHVVGRKNEAQTIKTYEEVLNPEQRSRVEVIDFTDKVYLYSGASDLTITRAGATNLAEFAIQGIACIIVPSTVLVAGHQLKNAEFLKIKKAAVVISDDELAENPHVLAKEVTELLKDPERLQSLGEELSKLGHTDAGQTIASLIIKTAEEK
jgi:UDP-N-acetylglucosamine--N-acetylmuramyl-(pentapeptide) pyrophosphoryl-undecaprenol N-acetylglucosamine transferase